MGLRKIARWLGIAAAAVGLIGLGLVGYVFLQSRKMPSNRPLYVAMGSSFAAGPGIASLTADSPSFCTQSDHNYAHQLAGSRNLSLVDMSCGGATSTHILNGGQLFQGPQMRALSHDTRLVTITIGGNDVFYLGNLIALGCDARPSKLARFIGACKVAAEADVDSGFVRLANNFRAIGDGIRRRAPAARVIVLTYPVILPENGTCARLGLSAKDAYRMRIVATRLDGAIRDGAKAMGAEVVDSVSVTRGHDTCARDPWVTSANPGGIAAPLHPNLAGMTALARRLEEMVR